MILSTMHPLDHLVCLWGEMVNNVARKPPGPLVPATAVLSGIEFLEKQK
ncbi:hypothetical protein JQW92_21055 [Sulfitobacter pseudonitzschiae]|nr:hypothetical protein [Pseudosulfitobacter pseudonitzschiae]MBM1834574.1 hypothetical protein [Pseudosulfitobacter pseudonitzschiae]MBM1839439.1 hypothetical protein [Pseudosulfitobacter pseudonitzschiae]MBM1849124.1 hypothetical protein [Pseudosulfitobacter pseudonitzschiae]MBM1868339.1 hypothetical protein [Pseudosulfitobacter pseudonitzschiae]MBM1873345.1 hypothetical protein [Pseudosulfitobacter pseudonitzschiae]